MKELTEKTICKNLKKMYDESESRVKTHAMISKAYADKLSSNTINDKVNAQMNSIKAEIYGINPKFKEGSKNYEHTKELVTETLANYENALVELSEFYDGKIEQLILRKVELEASLVGALLNEEYLYNKIMRKSAQRDNDKVKKSVRENIKAAIEKLKGIRKEKKEIDAKYIANLMDGQDVEDELNQKLNDRVEKSENEKKDNIEYIEKAEKEIALIEDEITRMNERKVKNIFDAMEVGDNAITTNIRRPKMFKKITRFFVSRFNTAKVVETTIIDPLNLRIESFKNNELINMKG